MANNEEVSPFEELKQGSYEAMDKIFKLWGDEIFNSAYSIVDNEQDAKDIRQQVLITLWERRHRLKIKDPRTYLQAAARNMALNHIKKQKNEATNLQKASIQQEVTQPPYEYEEPSQHREPSREKQLIDAVDKMPKQRASIFKQVKLEGKTRQMVADAEQIEVSTVDSHIQKALAQLRRWLKKKS